MAAAPERGNLQFPAPPGAFNDLPQAQKEQLTEYIQQVAASARDQEEAYQGTLQAFQQAAAQAGNAAGAAAVGNLLINNNPNFDPGNQQHVRDALAQLFNQPRRGATNFVFRHYEHSGTRIFRTTGTSLHPVYRGGRRNSHPKRTIS